MSADLIARLRALVAEWDEYARVHERDAWNAAAATADCADELRDLLEGRAT